MALWKLPDGRVYNDVAGKIESDATQAPTQKLEPAETEGGGLLSSIDFPRLGAEFAGGIVGGSLATPTVPASGPLGVLAGVGLGSEAGGQMMDLGRKYFGNKPIEDGILDRSKSAAQNVMLNMVGDKLGGDAINLAQRGVSSLLEPARRRIFGGTPDEVLRSYEKAGVQPSAGVVSGNRFIQGAEEAMARMPGSQSPMRLHQERFSSQLGDYADSVARTGSIIPLGDEGTSGVIAKGAKKAADRFSARWETLNDAVEEAVGTETRIAPTRSADLLDSMEQRYLADPEALGYMKQPIEYLRGIVKQGLDEDAPAEAIGDVSFGAIRKARTHIGKSLEQPTISGYTGDQGAQYRRIYGALTDDIREATEAVGGDAAKAFERAQRYARQNLSTRMPALEDIQKKSDVAYKMVMTGSRDTGAKLKIMRENLLPKEWDSVVSNTVEKMGRANPSSQNYQGDVFAPETFLTSWNKLSDGAKQQLFGGRRYSGLRSELDNLGKIVESIRDSRFMKNPSGTAQQSIFISMLTDPVAAVSGIALMGVPQNRLAKAFTDPKFVRWIARGARIDPANYTAIQTHVARMPIVAAGHAVMDEDEYESR